MTLSERIWPSRRRRRSSTAAIEQVVVLQPFGQQFQAQGELAPPGAMLVELLVEGSSHLVPVLRNDYSIGPFCHGSAFLAARAEIRCALPLPDHPWGAAHTTRLARPVVHHGLELEVAGLALGIGEVAQRAAALATARASTSRMAACSLRRAAADARGRQRRPDAGQEQRLRCIDVADADHHVAGQQHLLDRRLAPLAAPAWKAAGSKSSPSGSTPRPPSSLTASGAARRGMHHGAEAARVVQAQHAAVGDQVEVVVQRRLRHLRGRSAGCRTCPGAAAARPVQVQQQVLAAPPHAQHRAAHQRWGRHPSGQRSGLPRRTASMRAPAMRSAKLRRVTSTSGSSGMLCTPEGVDYDGLMKRFPWRRVRCCCSPWPGPPRAVPRAPNPTEPAPSQRPRRRMFYQLLLGELNARGDEPRRRLRADPRCRAQDQRPGAVPARRGIAFQAAPATPRCRPRAPGSRPSRSRARPIASCCRSWWR
jgi:hypothetical protein